MKLLNCTELAEELGYSTSYVSAMKSVGYKMLYGTKTTLAHALKWKEENHMFRSSDYFSRHRRKLPNPSRQAVCKSDE